MLLLASRSHAYYTNFLDSVSNTLSFVYTIATNDPPFTAAEKRTNAALARVLKTLSKPSTSVAGDYSLFLTAALQLGPIINDPLFFALGSNVFNLFTNDAQAQITATAGRIAALNNFVLTKKPASNALASARATLNRLSSIDPKLQIIVGRQAFTKIAVANRLAAIGEAHSGFARNTVIGKRLEHTEQGETGEVYFNNNVQASQDANLDSTYTYTRNGLNTATLVLVRPEVGGTNTTTVNLRFTSTSGGRFTFRNEDSDGDVQRGAGTFAIKD